MIPLLIANSKEQSIFEIEIFCNIIVTFTVTFDEFIASFMNINKYYWTVVYLLSDLKPSFCFSVELQGEKL